MEETISKPTGGLFSYYAYRDSFVHRLDPRVKALGVVVGLFYIFGTDDWRLLLTVAASNVILVMVAGIALSTLWPVLRALLSFGLVILVFQLLFQSGDVFLKLGPIGLHSNAFAITAKVWLRLAGLSLLFVGYMMWTHPVDMALMWVRMGVPYRFAMLGALAIRFFPILQSEVTRIQEAQQVRGQPLDTVWQRVTGLVTIILPFILRALRRTNDIALSMELRAFGYAKTRTFRRSIAMTQGDWLVAAILLALLIWRVLVMTGLA